MCVEVIDEHEEACGTGTLKLSEVELDDNNCAVVPVVLAQKFWHREEV